ncbi:MAG: IS982 family transposase [Candidatus Dadabacteria bacterium]|nr:IS982 family transposase [Candidatus Dadabacteria bacterium]
MSIVSLFCEIDDFFLEYEKMKSTPCLPEATRIDPRGRPRTLHPSEVMTVLIAFHQSGYRTFKHFYFKHVCVYWQAAFPRLVSYTRLVQLKKEVLRLLTFYLSTHTGTCRGISFVDSTRLRVCDNKRISFHKVFAEKVSERGKTSMGWFYGFKLHLIINDTGDILDVALTPGNRDDRSLLWGMNPETPLHGSLYGDRGYISKDLREKLRKQGIDTNATSNPRVMFF